MPAAPNRRITGSVHGTAEIDGRCGCDLAELRHCRSTFVHTQWCMSWTPLAHCCIAKCFAASHIAYHPQLGATPDLCCTPGRSTCASKSLDCMHLPPPAHLQAMPHYHDHILGNMSIVLDGNTAVRYLQQLRSLDSPPQQSLHRRPG